MMSDSNGRERGQERELKNESWVILLIVGMIMLCLMGVIALLVFPQTHMTLQAKCSPLDDPKIENNTRKGPTPQPARTNPV